MSLSTDLRAALDPAGFAANAAGITLDPWQADVLRSTRRRLLLNCTRQAGKSTVAAMLAAHAVMHQTDVLVLLVSPSLRQSSELFRKVSALLERLEQRPALIEDNRLSCTLDNGSRVVSLPSNEEKIRGFSAADLIIEDEAARVSDDLYRAIRPMLAISNGKLVLASTPHGKRGHFFEEWTHGGDTWERVMVTAPDCPRISAAFLDEERRSMGEQWFNQEYLCSFSDTSSQVFSYDLVIGALSSDILPLFGAGKDGT